MADSKAGRAIETPLSVKAALQTSVSILAAELSHQLNQLIPYILFALCWWKAVYNGVKLASAEIGFKACIASAI